MTYPQTIPVEQQYGPHAGMALVHGLEAAVLQY
jgi:hypothetical protein